MADSPPGPGIPLWVRIFGIIALVVLLLLVLSQLTGVMGEHGPGRHGHSDAVAAR